MNFCLRNLVGTDSFLKFCGNIVLVRTNADADTNTEYYEDVSNCDLQQLRLLFKSPMAVNNEPPLSVWQMEMNVQE